MPSNSRINLCKSSYTGQFVATITSITFDYQKAKASLESFILAYIADADNYSLGFSLCTLAILIQVVIIGISALAKTIKGSL